MRAAERGEPIARIPAHNEDTAGKPVETSLVKRFGFTLAKEIEASFVHYEINE